MSIKAQIGDLFKSEVQTLVNTVNCVGIMGKGIAAIFKKDYPEMFAEYKELCERKQVRLGEPYLYTDLAGAHIVNFPTKNHWKAASRIADIEKGLDYFVAHAKAWGITSVAFPPLGCGNGGLDWEQVGPLMYRKLRELGIPVEIYAPYGTPPNQLKEDFLAGAIQQSLDGKGQRPEKFNDGWIPLLEVVRGIQMQPYAYPVGRVIFQKICYILTEMKVPTGFRFGKGDYGPFAEEVQAARHALANKNWIIEQQKGPMLAVCVTDVYEKERNHYKDTIQHFDKKVMKAIDLFSRIKNTDQAEEITTVLYSSKELKRAYPDRLPTQSEIRDYILNWKPSWNQEEKIAAVNDAIINLTSLRWMNADLQVSTEDANE